jgi:LmeA-like phospholipid-binding
MARQTRVMERARVGDMLRGAAGMLVVMVVAVAVLWWVATEPAGDAGTRGPSLPVDTGQVWGLEPPTDLAEDEAWFAELGLDAWTLVTADSTLRDVRAVGQDVVTSPAAVVAGRVTVEATVPFELVAAELGEDAQVSAAADGQATLVRTVEVQGRELRVTATGTVEAVGGRLRLEPRSIEVGEVDFLADEIADVVRRLVTIDHDIEGLPEGLVLGDVAVQGDGFRATLHGEDVELVP